MRLEMSKKNTVPTESPPLDRWRVAFCASSRTAKATSCGNRPIRQASPKPSWDAL